MGGLRVRVDMLQLDVGSLAERVDLAKCWWPLVVLLSFV